MAKKQQAEAPVQEESFLGDDTFLRDEIHPSAPGLSVLDGFRFGFGFIIAFLLVALIVGGLTTLIVQLLR